jgi:UDP-N-acetyl-D-glucosamine dehydrogenase
MSLKWFMPFYPGPGLGGHCISIDPFYLTWKAREYGQHTRFIELAGEINTRMPEYVVNHVCVNYQELGWHAQLIIDTRNAMAGVETKPGQVWKA